MSKREKFTPFAIMAALGMSSPMFHGAAKPLKTELPEEIQRRASKSTHDAALAKRLRRSQRKPGAFSAHSEPPS